MLHAVFLRTHVPEAPRELEQTPGAGAAILGVGERGQRHRQLQEVFKAAVEVRLGQRRSRRRERLQHVTDARQARQRRLVAKPRGGRPRLPHHEAVHPVRPGDLPC
jgi:hypothetical protein